MGRGSGRNIEILISTALNPEGFNRTRAALADLGLQAKEFDYQMGQTYTSVNSAGAATKGLGERMGGARGPVADLTRALLFQIGATQGVGEVGKLAGIGILALEGAATPATLAMVAMTAAVAFLIPTIVSLTGKNSELEKSNKAAADSFAGVYEKLKEFADKAVTLSPALSALFGAMRQQEGQGQVDALRVIGSRLREIRTALGDGDLRRQLEAAQGKDLKFFPGLKEAVEKAETLRAEERLLTAQGHALAEAMEAGTTVSGLLAREQDALALSEEKVRKAAEAAKRAQDQLNDAFAEGAAGQLERQLAAIAPLLEKDAAALAKMEKERSLGALSPELLEMLTRLPGEAEETGAALSRLGFDLGSLTGDAELVTAAFREVKDLLSAGLINPEMAQQADRMLLHIAEQLRGLGVAVDTGMTQGQESIIDLSGLLEGEALDAAGQFTDAIIAGATGSKIAWDQFMKSMMRNFLAAIAKAIILRTIMHGFGMASGGGISASGIDSASPGGVGAIAPGVGTGASGGMVFGGMPGLDSVRAMLMPGEIVLPVPLADDFKDFAAIVHEARAGRAGRAVSVDRAVNMPIQIFPQRDRERDAIDLLEEINQLVERRGYRLVASQVTA